MKANALLRAEPSVYAAECRARRRSCSSTSALENAERRRARHCRRDPRFLHHVENGADVFEGTRRLLCEPLSRALLEEADTLLGHLLFDRLGGERVEGLRLVQEATG